MKKLETLEEYLQHLYNTRREYQRAFDASMYKLRQLSLRDK